MSTQQKYIDIKEQRGQYWLENIMKDKFAVSMFGQKRLSREGGIPITFAKARKKYMNLTPICYKAKDIEKLGLDYVVVGSDEVWNYRETKGNARVKFGIGLNNERLVAYAPSVGQTHELNVPEYVKEGILQFKAVSARDQLTEQLAEEIRNEEIERVTDPTFLVHIPDEKVSSVSQPYMLFYYCDGLPEAEKQKLIDYAHQNGMAVYGAGKTKFGCREKGPFFRDTVSNCGAVWISEKRIYQSLDN